jgi:hypothetical protein
MMSLFCSYHSVAHVTLYIYTMGWVTEHQKKYIPATRKSICRYLVKHTKASLSTSCTVLAALVSASQAYSQDD